MLPSSAGSSPTELFRPRTIVVGNHASREWLEMAWAREFGIAAGLETPSLGGLIERLANAAFGPVPADANAALRLPALTARIDALLDRVAASGAKDPLVGFLERVREPKQRLRLAGTLAQQFLELRREQPDTLTEWERNVPRGDLVAQIWHRLHRDLEQRLEELARDRRPAQTGTARLTELSAALLDRDVPLDRDLSRGVVIFGADRISPPEARILAALSTRCDVWLGLYSPISAFMDPTEDGATQDLCRRLARPARDLLETLTEDLGLDFENFDADPEPAEAPETLLGVFQQQIRAGESRDGQAGVSKLPFVDPLEDHSLEIHEADGPRRESEVARERILAACDADPTLRAEEILLLVPDIEEYAAPLRAAFAAVQEHSPSLGLYFVDRPPGELDDVHHAMIDLLARLDGPLGLGSTFEVLRSAPIARRFDLAGEDIEDCLDLAHRAGISWGLDLEHRAQMEAPAEFRLGTWKAGLDRLVLGHLYGFESEDDLPEAVELPTGLQVPTSHGFAERALRIESLIEVVQALENAQREVSRERSRVEWPPVLRTILDGFFTTADTKEQRAMQLGLRAIAEIEQHLELMAEVDRQRPVSFARIRALFERTLDGLIRGPQFSGTLTVARLGSKRPFPARVLVILGLTDQLFPGDPSASPLDRLGGKRGRLGIDRREDRSETFLNALISAEDRVILTAPGRSVVDGSERTRSSVLEDLLHWFARSFEPSAEGLSVQDRLICRHPLRSDDARCFDRTAKDPRLQSSDRSALEVAASRRSAVPDDQSHRRSWFRESETVGLHETGPRTDDGDERLVLDLTDLESFWRSPTRDYLRRRLGAHSARDQELVRDSELQALDSLTNYQLTSLLVERESRPDDRLLQRSGLTQPSPAAPTTAAKAWLTSASFVAYRKREPLRTTEGVPDRVEISLDIDLPARKDHPNAPARRIRLLGELQGLSAHGVLIQAPTSSEWKHRLIGRLRQAVATLRADQESPNQEPEVRLYLQTKSPRSLVTPAEYSALSVEEARELLALLVQGFVESNEAPLPFDSALMEGSSFLSTDADGITTVDLKKLGTRWRDSGQYDVATRLLGITSSPSDSPRFVAWVEALSGVVEPASKSGGRR